MISQPISVRSFLLLRKYKNIYKHYQRQHDFYCKFILRIQFFLWHFVFDWIKVSTTHHTTNFYPYTFLLLFSINFHITLGFASFSLSLPLTIFIFLSFIEFCHTLKLTQEICFCLYRHAILLPLIRLLYNTCYYRSTSRSAAWMTSLWVN